MTSESGEAPRKQVDLFRVPVDALTMSEVRERCARAVREKSPIRIGCLNAAKVVKLDHDPELRAAIESCDVIIADGASVVLASRLVGRPLPERVAGIDLFTDLLADMSEREESVFLFGAAEDVLQKVMDYVREEHPGVRIAGSRNGYFSEEEEAGIVDEIRAADPDYLFIAITTPKKEFFIARHGAATGARVCHGVGGSFDVIAGKVKRAPRIWQRLGLEWLYRVLQEPGRLWRRYLVTNAVFLAMTVKERFRRVPAEGASGTDAG